MLNFTHISYHNKHSNTLVFMLPGVNKGCDKKNQMDIFNSIVETGISCVSMNYSFQDDSTPFDPHAQRTQEYDDIKQLRLESNNKQYTNVIFIGKSLGGVILSELIPSLGWSQDQQRQFIILGYVPGITNIEQLTIPIAIIQGEYDRFGNIDAVRHDSEDYKHSIEYITIPNADHSYYDHKDPSIGYQYKVIQIINNIIIQQSK